MTMVMGPKQDFIVRTVTNNNTSPKVYEVTTSKISNPTDNGQQLTMPPGELLYAPKRFVLQAGKSQNTKLYYKGPTDNQERYYRVNFTESPAAQKNNQKQTYNRGTLELKMELQSILVVRPRQVKFNYTLNEATSTIQNSGNTFFEFMVKQGCDQPDDEADSKYLLPGETYHNTKIGQPGNQILIVYQSRFIPIDKMCK
ncbi:fimbria/pilus periplasmic chaperone [Aeromonas hydrophila]|uniref:fimbria/pilus periplasmic chaperone n=1 Tax=Aeromonas hydrophila TaxID=644 RepID=UPI003987C120